MKAATSFGVLLAGYVAESGFGFRRCLRKVLYQIHITISAVGKAGTIFNATLRAEHLRNERTTCPSRAKVASNVLTPEATACTFNPEVLYRANSGYRMVE